MQAVLVSFGCAPGLDIIHMCEFQSSRKQKGLHEPLNLSTPDPSNFHPPNNQRKTEKKRRTKRKEGRKEARAPTEEPRGRDGTEA